METIEAGFHARCAASSAERWMNCPGCLNLQGDKASATSRPAAEGTFAHSIAAQCLLDGKDAVSALGAKAIVEGFEVECDEDMAASVQTYLDNVREFKDEQVWSELSLHEALRKLDPDLGGTADYVGRTGKKLRVADFKHGAGTFVSADDNRQLKIYALGTMLEVNKPGDEVEVCIIQPRYEGALPVRKESFPAWTLMEFAADVVEAARATRDPNAPLKAGPWCKKTFCPNLRICPEVEKMQHALVAAELNAVEKYDPQTLGELLDKIPLVEQRIKELKEFAYAELAAGRSIPGYKLVEKRPRRCWTDEQSVIAWAESRAIDPYAPRELKSPAQLEKVGKLKKAEKEELKAFTATVSSGTTMAPASDARPAVTQQLTVDDFAAISGPQENEPLTADNMFS